MKPVSLLLLLTACTGEPSIPESPEDTSSPNAPIDTATPPEGDTDEDTFDEPWSATLTIDGDLADCPEGASFSTDDASACLTWDTDYLYVGYSHGDLQTGGSQHFFVLYLGAGASTGSEDGVLYNTQQPTLPFSATHHLRAKGDASFAGYLVPSEDEWVIPDTLTIEDGDLFHNRTTGTLEARIPRSAFGDATTLNLWMGMLFEGELSESTYGAFPDASIEAGFDPNPSSAWSLDLSSADGPSALE